MGWVVFCLLSWILGMVLFSSVDLPRCASCFPSSLSYISGTFFPLVLLPCGPGLSFLFGRFLYNYIHVRSTTVSICFHGSAVDWAGVLDV